MHEKPFRAGQIRPMADGRFLLTGWNGVCGGWKCVPANGKLQQVWEKRGESEVSADTNFDPESMVGVWTDYQYVTRVIDLRTGKRLFLIDNSANYEAELISTSSPGRGQNRRADSSAGPAEQPKDGQSNSLLVALWIGGTVSLLLVWLVFAARRRQASL
jgi:hypothetical protein